MPVRTTIHGSEEHCSSLSLITNGLPNISNNLFLNFLVTSDHLEHNQSNEQLQPLPSTPADVKNDSENTTSETPTSTPEVKEQTPATSQPRTSNSSGKDLLKADIEPQTQKMEVQKHPHHFTHKKKWVEYILEFLMIFFAVFLGFLAENFREHQVEKERERQYVLSLVQDLQEDTAILHSQISIHKTNIAQMDSFATILIDPAQIKKSANELYYFGRLAPRIRNFTENGRTYEQLKNSGNFRLIGDPEVSNKIMSYYLKLPHIRQLEGIYAGEFAEYKKIAVQVFEPLVFMRQVNEANDVFRTTDNPPLQTTDANTLKQLAVYAIYMNGSRRTIFVYEQRLLQSASELISFLQKKYHLSNT